jgi:hypothetical protein
VVLDFPLGSEAEVVLVCFDGSLAFVVLLVWPPGLSVVVVLEVDWANTPPPNTKLKPRAAAASFDLESIFSSLLVVINYALFSP